MLAPAPVSDWSAGANAVAASVGGLGPLDQADFSAPEVAAWISSLPPGPVRDAVASDTVVMSLLQQMEQYERALASL